MAMQLSTQQQIQDFGQGGSGVFTLTGQGHWAQHLLTIGFFRLKLPENCMILKKSLGARGVGPPGRSGSASGTGWSFQHFLPDTPTQKPAGSVNTLPLEIPSKSAGFWAHESPPAELWPSGPWIKHVLFCTPQKMVVPAQFEQVFLLIPTNFRVIQFCKKTFFGDLGKGNFKGIWDYRLLWDFQVYKPIRITRLPLFLQSVCFFFVFSPRLRVWQEALTGVACCSWKGIHRSGHHWSFCLFSAWLVIFRGFECAVQQACTSESPFWGGDARAFQRWVCAIEYTHSFFSAQQTNQVQMNKANTVFSIQRWGEVNQK